MHTYPATVQWREVLLCFEEYRDSACTYSLVKVKDIADKLCIESEFKPLSNQEEKAIPLMKELIN